MRSHLVVFFWILCSLSSKAQIATGILDINNLRVGVSANGMLFYDETEQEPMFEVPADSGTFTFRASHLWIGGMSPDQEIKLAASTYNDVGHDFWSGPLSTEGSASISSNTIAAYNHVWKVNQSDLQLHVAYYTAVENGTEDILFPDGYTIPSYFFDWPAHGASNLNQAPYLAPFFDFNGDGNYDPEDGDCPLICGDQALYIIFNDKGDVHSQSGGAAMGVEVHAMIYAFGDNEEPHDIVERTVFVRYRIINRGTQTFTNTYIGQFADMNHGNPDDDHAACFVNRGAFSGTNGDEFDEPFAGGENFGGALGIQNVMFLRGATMDANASDDPYPYNDGVPFAQTYANASFGFGDGIEDNEQLGLSSFVSYVNDSHPIFGQPSQASHYYNYLRGLWKNSQPMVYYYSPFEPLPSQQVLCDYMYPGVSDPQNAGTGGFAISGWSESASANPPGDRCAIGSTGPFTFSPGDEQTIDLAFVYSGSPSFAINANHLQTISAYFNDSITDCLAGEFVIPVQELNEPSALSIYPNPVHSLLHVKHGHPFRSARWTVLNSLGEELKSGIYQGNIDASDLSNGMYILRFENDRTVYTTRFIKE